MNTAKAEEYFTKSSHWLAEGNEAEDAGKIAKAERCFEKSQYWLDRANKAAGNA